MAKSNEFWICLELLTALGVLFPGHYTQSKVALSPSTKIAVCPGDQLALTCNTSSDVHQWIIEDPNTRSTHTRLIVVSSSMAQITPLQIQSFMFNFAIISPPSALPLISTLSADNASAYLNTTRITCLEINFGNRQEVTVYIFGPNSLESIIPLNYGLLELGFGIKNATILLLFSKSNMWGTSVSYSVTTSSQAEILSQGRTRFQLVVPYNSQINMNTVASLCGQNTTPTIIQLSYTNCGYPLEQKSSNIPESEMITDPEYDVSSDWPLIKGTNATYSCPHEFALTGPDTSTCMENGLWAPNPRDVKCRRKANCGPPSMLQNDYVYPFTSTLEGARVVFTCSKPGLSETNSTIETVCSENGTWIVPNSIIQCTKQSDSGVETSDSVWTDDVMLAIISSSVTFVMTTVFCFTIGFVINGCMSRKCTKQGSCRSVNMTNPMLATNSNLVYEDVLPKDMWPQKRELEMKENEAYRIIQH